MVPLRPVDWARSRPARWLGAMSLQRKLMLGFGLVVLIVAALLVGANRAATSASENLEDLLTTQLRPLAVANRLQSRLTRIHHMEMELPRLDDYFAITSHIEVMRSEISAFATDLAPFHEQLARETPMRAQRLQQTWRAYRRDLQRMSEAAMRMDMDRVRRISIYEASSRFDRIARVFNDVAAEKERTATARYERSLAEDRQRRRVLLAMSVLGLLALATGLTLFSRHLSRRVSGLRDAAIGMAGGQATEPIDAAGGDELSDLAEAFNTMQGRVAERERALRQAHDELEDRVAERTRALHESNDQLVREIEERRRAEERLRLLSKAVEQSPVGVVIADVDGRIEYVNEALLETTGHDGEHWTGGALDLEALEAGAANTSTTIRDALARGRDWEGELLSRRVDGTHYWERMRITPVSDGAGNTTHLLATREDISDRKAQEQKILYQARYDALTDLPNRLLTMDRLSHAIASARRHAHMVALMFVDLDDFKKVNDTLGHEVGDRLLIEAATRLRGAVRLDDTVGRQGGDEFLVIMGGLKTGRDAEAVAHKVVDAFKAPFRIGDNELFVSSSIGIAVYPDDGSDSGTLLRNADAAVYQAKDAGRNTYRFFSAEIRDDSVRRLEIESHLRGALEREELRIQYQPLVDATSGGIVQVEALLRWDHPELGAVAPRQFVAVAEQTGLIVPIGEWVLRNACAAAAYWRGRGLPGIGVAVNVSPRQCRTPLVGTVRGILADTGLPPEALEVEIHEGVLVRNQPEVRSTLEALAAMGVRLAMDEFGTGQSSLSHLKLLPFSTLKIDHAFVHDLSRNPDDRALIDAAVSMGRGLGMRIAAVGVEGEAEGRLLAEAGCDLLQGYHFGAPVDPEQLLEAWAQRVEC